ncbi:MAG: EAL domain-containing protein [Burkholderiaceae bacterium]|jgi:diguanylate cyclase (GGDEF)-like protein|nr:EAL domain-containing protein [Burkholderiaceae bacterium]
MRRWRLLPPDTPLASALGRRLLGMLVVATLLPMALLALLTDLKVSQALREQRDAELAQHAKNYGLTLLERLGRVEDVAQSLRTSLAGNRPLAQLRTTELVNHGTEILALARVDEAGVIVESAGPLPSLASALTMLDATARNDLANGRSVLLLPPRAGDPVSMLVPLTPPGAPGRYVALALDPAWLWGDADLAPVMTSYCVVAGSRRLSCPAPVPGALPVEQVQGGQRAGLAWTVNGDAQRAGAWTMFVGSRFSGENWTVFAVQPAAFAVAATREFRSTFVPLALGCLLVVLILATRQVRRISAPIRELLRGTQRLAQRDFSSQVAVTGRDEFGQLASAFNTMARRLALQFGTLQAMSRIDRAILNSVDLSDVAVNSIRCLRQIVDTDLISIGLIHPESPTQLMVQTRRRGSRGIEKLELAWPEAARAADNGEGQVQLPADYSRHLGAPPGRDLRVLPILRGGAFWGVVVLGDRVGQEIDADRASMLSGVVDRLAVALSTAARDWRLHVQAHFDPLTGLPNRMHLLTLLNQHIAAARRDQERGAVLFLDLDRFKQTNDTLGHAAGDLLLRLAAERIRLAVRESDSVARIGGDEFTVVLPRIASSRDAGQVAANLIAALARPFELDGQKIYAGGSVGIALYPDDGVTAEELLKRADTAMYRAKDLGRGRFAFFKESMGAEVSARATLDRELRQALERREFVLHYQPVIDVATGAVIGAEALLRWQHPNRGLLGPGEFIEFAEESGLIESIGTWVLHAACEQHRQWEAAGIALPRMSVNVSNRQLRQPGFVASVDLALMRSERAPSQLEIEITESMVVEAGEGAMRTLGALRDAGVCVAIDDFGTGYSSFGYLRTLPAAVLKLDRTFVIDIATDPDADTIAASMIHMARTLRKTVVVEGVETDAQFDLLARHGAHRIQGYLVSRPLAAPQFERFMHEYTPARYARALPPLRVVADADAPHDSAGPRTVDPSLRALAH